MLRLLLYLEAGILADMVVTAYTLFATRGRSLTPALLSFGITLLNLFVLIGLLGDPEWSSVLAYAAGNAVGCFLTIETMKRR